MVLTFCCVFRSCCCNSDSTASPSKQECVVSGWFTASQLLLASAEERNPQYVLVTLVSLSHKSFQSRISNSAFSRTRKKSLILLNFLPLIIVLVEIIGRKHWLRHSSRKRLYLQHCYSCIILSCSFWWSLYSDSCPALQFWIHELGYGLRCILLLSPPFVG